jgi:predicted component of type VI protein secretion system
MFLTGQTRSIRSTPGPESRTTEVQSGLFRTRLLDGLRVVLSCDGGNRGRVCWLHAGQTVDVGGSEWADLAVPDPGLEEIHFRIHADATGVHLLDLGSRHGTGVNGTPARKAMLRDGDTIQAGHSRFHVRISGETAAMASRKFDYSVEPTRSGLDLYRGGSGLGSLRTLLETVAEVAPLSLIVNRSLARQPMAQPGTVAGEGRDADPVSFEETHDPTRLGETTLANAPLTIPLANPPAGLGLWSVPTLVQGQTVADVWNLIEELWDRQGAICLFSHLDAPELAERLRPQAGSLSDAATSRSHLRKMTPAYTRHLLRDLLCLIVPDRRGDWELFSDPETVPSWADLNFPTPPMASEWSGRDSCVSIR